MTPTQQQAKEMADKCALALPPDVQEHPIPFPSRLIYAAKVIREQLNLDQLLEDKRRLDWLQQSKWLREFLVHQQEGSDIREAISTAMRDEGM